jgi:hypothetical protein
MMGIFFIKNLKNLITGILIGLLIGLWVGSNLAKGRSIFSNPFANGTIQSKIKKTGNKVLEQSGKALEKSGKALRDAVSSNN